MNIIVKNNIRHYLELRGKTQQWLADELKTNKQTVNNWCMDIATPDHCKMIGIAVLLKVKDVRKLYEVIKEDKDV